MVKKDREIKINQDWSWFFIMKLDGVVVDLTGATAKLEIKATKGVDETSLLTLTVGTGITITEVAGKVAVDVSQA